MALLHGHRAALIFGILGNVMSFLVYLAPLPTFYRIFKKKSTEGFHSIPYSVALFSAMLMLYYASLKNDAFILITINSIGCLIESIYLTFYMIYATRSSLIFTTKLLIFFNMGAYALIVMLTSVFVHDESLRVHVVGWICAVFSVCVFAAPLSIIRLVIRTESVEYMPFSLSVCLTLCAVFWLGYGLAVTDYYVAAPNILGFLFGLTQMMLFFVYKNRRSEILPEIQPQEEELAVADTANECKDENTREPSDSNQTEESEMNELNQPEQPSEFSVSPLVHGHDSSQLIINMSQHSCIDNKKE